MDNAIRWMLDNWTTVVAAAYVLDKVAKATPTKYDDFVVEVLFNAVKKLVGKA